MAETPKPPPEQGGADPSMEDILASIRRILSEEEAPPAAPGGKPPPGAGDVLVLDPSMLVPEDHELPDPVRPDPMPPAETPEHVAAVPVPIPLAESMEPLPEPSAPEPSAPLPHQTIEPASLVAPEAAAAAASSVGALMRTLASERGLSVTRGGPSLEDIVREELRPLLKTWLDTNLPPVVERLVRAEIERVVGRAAP